MYLFVSCEIYPICSFICLLFTITTFPINSKFSAPRKAWIVAMSSMYLIGDIITHVSISHELTSCQVDAIGGAKAFSRRPDRGQHVFQGGVELGILQGVVPQSPEQLPLSILRPSWGIRGLTYVQNFWQDSCCRFSCALNISLSPG